MPTATLESVRQDADSSLSFVNDFAAFRRTYKMAREAWQNDTNPLNSFYNIDGPVLGSEFSPVGHMFGIELEFNSSVGYYDEDDDSLAEWLHTNGYTAYPYMQSYHSGMSDTSRWRFEDDGSVSGGEVISPILRDRADSWDELHKVITAIKNNGGTAEDYSAGGHVNIDTTSLGNDVASWNRLRLLVQTFEDVMYRLAANPHRAKTVSARRGTPVASLHRRRSSHYAEPVRMGTDSGSTVPRNMNRGTWINTSNVNERTGMGRIEFRIFDGTLDAAIIQTHVKIASAFVRAATNADLDSVLSDLPDRPVGFHRRAEWRAAPEGGTAPTRLSGEAWRQDTEAIRQFVDMLFTDSADREQVISLFAMNDWNWARRSRR